MTQNYHGEKIVRAWEQPQNGVEGYAVRYEDGYTSWSPKETFEAAYLAIGHVDGLPDWHQRLVAEKLRMEDRVTKLSGALNNEAVVAKLDPAQVDLMRAQLPVMKQLADILGQRLDLLTPELFREEAQVYTAEIDLKSSRIDIFAMAPEGSIDLSDSLGNVVLVDVKDPQGNSLKDSLQVNVVEPGARSIEREVKATVQIDGAEVNIDFVINTQTAALTLGTNLQTEGYKLVLEVHRINMNRLSAGQA